VSATGRSLCHRRSTCRLCGGGKLTPILSFAPTPPANAFVGRAEIDKPQPTFPLDVAFCEDCTHVQLLDVVDPGLLFSDYVYVSGTSPAFVEHFARLAHELLARYRPAPASLIVDIGSNDGTLLGFFKDAGMAVLGVDPARDIARRATERGLETRAEFFTPTLARRIREERGAAAIVTANNVFAHIDDLAAVTEGVRALLAADGVFVFEVSYLLDVYRKTLFDTIYHEHLSYHSARPLPGFLAANGMQLIEAERIDVHGGSLRATAQRAGGPHPVGASVRRAIASETRSGLDKATTFADFGRRVAKLREELRRLLSRLKADGKSIAGYGAPAKATTLMHHFDLGPETIDFIVDDSPLKQGLYSPGHHIPVLPAAAIEERRPDYLLILAWNFAEPIIAGNTAFHDAGGRFIIPVPKLEIV
jgi:SAM-dependent methyltransferase